MAKNMALFTILMSKVVVLFQIAVAPSVVFHGKEEEMFAFGQLCALLHDEFDFVFIRLLGQAPSKVFKEVGKRVGKSPIATDTSIHQI